MKYCNKCGVLYSSELACCPKCNAALTETPEGTPPEASPKEIRRQWVWICIGVPLLITAIYFLAWGMKVLGE